MTGAAREDRADGFTASPFASLRFGHFRFLMLLQLGNAIGVWAQVVASQWILAADGASATVVSFVPAAMSLPFLVFALPVGVLVSQHPREKLMSWAMGLAAASSAIAWWMSASGDVGRVALILCVAVVGFGLVTIGIAWQSLLPETVSRELVASAAILDGATFNTARAVGPVMAGVGLSVLGPTWVFALTAALFAVCAVAMAYSGVRHPSRVGVREPVVASIIAGLHFTRYSPWTKRLLFRMVMFGIPSSCLWALLPLVARDRLELGSVGFGMLTAMLGIGAIVGTVLVAPLRGRMSVNAFAMLGTIAYAGVLAGSAGFTQPWLVGAFMLIGGVAWVGVQSTWMMLAHQALPTWVRPRIVALILLLFQGTQAVGALLWGAAADSIGLGPAIFCASGVLIVTAGGIARRGLYSSVGIEPDLADVSGDGIEVGNDGAGEAVVEHVYAVTPENLNEFFDAMRDLRMSRLRTGATHWQLLADPHSELKFIELYHLRSRSEFIAQETERLTVPELGLRERVGALIVGESSRRVLVSVLSSRKGVGNG